MPEPKLDVRGIELLLESYANPRWADRPLNVVLPEAREVYHQLRALYSFAKPLLEAAGGSRIVGVAVECDKDAFGAELYPGGWYRVIPVALHGKGG